MYAILLPIKDWGGGGFTATSFIISTSMIIKRCCERLWDGYEWRGGGGGRKFSFLRYIKWRLFRTKQVKSISCTFKCGLCIILQTELSYSFQSLWAWVVKYADRKRCQVFAALTCYTSINANSCMACEPVNKLFNYAWISNKEKKYISYFSHDMIYQSKDDFWVWFPWEVYSQHYMK